MKQTTIINRPDSSLSFILPPYHFVNLLRQYLCNIRATPDDLAQSQFLYFPSISKMNINYFYPLVWYRFFVVATITTLHNIQGIAYSVSISCFAFEAFIRHPFPPLPVRLSRPVHRQQHNRLF